MWASPARPAWSTCRSYRSTAAPAASTWTTWRPRYGAHARPDCGPAPATWCPTSPIRPGSVSTCRPGAGFLDLAAELDILIIEDNPYGFFGDGAPPKPTLKSLDTGHRVVYLGSYAKTALPGARIGFVVADQPVVRDGELLGTLADELSKIKSMITVNTPPIAQAVIGGKLLESGFALREANRDATARYGQRLRHLLDGLATRFPAPSPVTWNRPDGGFFLVVTVPFVADDDLLAHSAERHKVIWTPMHHFYAAGADSGSCACPAARSRRRRSTSVWTGSLRW